LFKEREGMAEDRKYTVTGFQTDAKGMQLGDQVLFRMLAEGLEDAYTNAKTRVKNILGGQSSVIVEEMDVRTVNKKD